MIPVIPKSFFKADMADLQVLEYSRKRIIEDDKEKNIDFFLHLLAINIIHRKKENKTSIVEV